MMMFSMTSTASASEIQAALNVSYNGLVGGGSASLSAEQKKILQTATVHLATMGGSDSSAIAAIRSGDFRQYFTSSPSLQTAAPLSYQFNDLADNLPAQVSEATNYDLKTCQEAGAPGVGQFDFLPAQSFAAPVPTPFDTRLVDVNGDGLADLVFNHRDASSNQVAVAVASGDGSFAAPGAAVSLPATPAGGWKNYQLVTGDFNGDGKADLAWTYPVVDSIHGDSLLVDVALADGSGGWTILPAEWYRAVWYPTGSVAVVTGFKAYVGDIDGDGKSDLILNSVSSGDSVSLGDNDVWALRSKGDGTFSGDVVQLGGAGWEPYITGVADVNGDGMADLCWDRTLSTSNTIEVAMSKGNGLFSSPTVTYQDPYGNWARYQSVVADFNGDQTPDWLFYSAPDTTSQHLPSQVFLVSGMKDELTRIHLDSVFPTLQYKLLAGDVNGDGKADVILNATSSTTNTVAVMLGTSTIPSVGADSLQADTVSANWSTANPAMVGDVNGDGNADVVWVIPGSPTRVFVAKSKGSVTGS